MKYPYKPQILATHCVLYFQPPKKGRVLQLASKPRVDWWHRPSCLLQAAWLVQRGLSAARGAAASSKKQLHYPLTPPLPPLSPVSASLQLPSVCWISHTKTQPWGIWTRAPASLSDCMGLHITSRCILVIDFLISLCTLLHLLCTRTTEWKNY